MTRGGLLPLSSQTPRYWPATFCQVAAFYRNREAEPSCPLPRNEDENTATRLVLHCKCAQWLFLWSLLQAPLKTKSCPALCQHCCLLQCEKKRFRPQLVHLPCLSSNRNECVCMCVCVCIYIYTYIKSIYIHICIHTAQSKHSESIANYENKILCF